MIYFKRLKIFTNLSLSFFFNKLPLINFTSFLLGLTKSKIVTLASDQNIKIINLAKQIIKLTKSKSKIKYAKKKKRSDDFTSNFISSRKTYNSVGWKPKFNLNSGLKVYIKNKNF